MKIYICTKSNWQSDNWSPVAGPFDNKTEAEKARGAAEDHGLSGTGGIDIKNEIHAKIVTRTELRQMGWSDDAELATHLLDVAKDKARREEEEAEC